MDQFDTSSVITAGVVWSTCLLYKDHREGDMKILRTAFDVSTLKHISDLIETHQVRSICGLMHMCGSISILTCVVKYGCYEFGKHMHMRCY